MNYRPIRPIPHLTVLDGMRVVEIKSYEQAVHYFGAGSNIAWWFRPPPPPPTDEQIAAANERRERDRLLDDLRALGNAFVVAAFCSQFESEADAERAIDAFYGWGES